MAAVSAALLATLAAACSGASGPPNQPPASATPAGTCHAGVSGAENWIMGSGELSAAQSAGASSVRYAVSSAHLFVLLLRGQTSAAGQEVADFRSYAEFKKMIKQRAIPAGVRWVMYDNEQWSLTPADEQADPVRYEQLFGQLAHRHGYRVILAPAQDLVLWSRLGAFDTAELDRLLWQERALFEFDAFIYPMESLPLIRARIRRNRRATALNRDRWRREFVAENAGFRRYVLRELERRGPLLSRELADHSTRTWSSSGWWGNRNVAVMLEILHRRGVVAIVGRRGEVAIVGRRSGQRLWDLAERWYPETGTVPVEDAERLLAEKRFRALGVRFESGEWRAHPDAADGSIPNRVTFLSPFDRLVHDRDRAEALFGFRYRLEMYVPKAKREYGYYVLPILRGDRLVGRIEPVFDRRSRRLRVNAVWWEDGAKPLSLQRPLRSLARFLGAVSIEH